MGVRTITANDVELETESFGDPEEPTLLLVMGAAFSRFSWPEGFIDLLVAGGRHVIRFDHRDTGRSTSKPVGEWSYTIADLADDAVGVLDAFGIERAHVVGTSMGGMVGQLLALDHRDRLETLTLISSSPGPVGPTGLFSGTEVPQELPGPEGELMEAVVGMVSVDWDDLESIIQGYLAIYSRVGSADGPATIRGYLEREWEHAGQLASTQNHFIAQALTPPWRHRLGEVDVPTLVVHGAVDGLLPLAHPEALTREIPGAELLVIEGMSHDLPESAWGPISAAILRHSGG